VAAAGRSLDWDNVTRLRRIGLRREWKGGRRLRTIARRADCKTGTPLENAHYLPASVTTTSPACSPTRPASASTRLCTSTATRSPPPGRHWDADDERQQGAPGLDAAESGRDTTSPSSRLSKPATPPSPGHCRYSSATAAPTPKLVHVSLARNRLTSLPGAVPETHARTGAVARVGRPPVPAQRPVRALVDLAIDDEEPRQYRP
jgi:hypothetical protein